MWGTVIFVLVRQENKLLWKNSVDPIDFGIIKKHRVLWYLTYINIYVSKICSESNIRWKKLDEWIVGNSHRPNVPVYLNA